MEYLMETNFTESVVSGDFSYDESQWAPEKSVGSWRTASMSASSSDCTPNTDDASESESGHSSPSISSVDSSDHTFDLRNDFIERGGCRGAVSMPNLQGARPLSYTDKKNAVFDSIVPSHADKKNATFSFDNVVSTPLATNNTLRSVSVNDMSKLAGITISVPNRGSQKKGLDCTSFMKKFDLSRSRQLMIIEEDPVRNVPKVNTCDDDDEESELSETDSEGEYSDSDSEDEESEFDSDEEEEEEEEKQEDKDFERSPHHHTFDLPLSESINCTKSSIGLGLRRSASLADTSYQCNSFYSSRVIMSQMSLNRSQENGMSCALDEAKNNFGTYKNVGNPNVRVETKNKNEESNIPSPLASKCNPNATSTYVGVNFGGKDESQRTSFLNQLSRPNPSLSRFAGTSIGQKAEPKKSSLMEQFALSMGQKAEPKRSSLMEQFALSRASKQVNTGLNHKVAITPSKSNSTSSLLDQSRTSLSEQCIQSETRLGSGEDQPESTFFRNKATLDSSLFGSRDKLASYSTPKKLRKNANTSSPQLNIMSFEKSFENFQRVRASPSSSKGLGSSDGPMRVSASMCNFSPTYVSNTEKQNEEFCFASPPALMNRSYRVPSLDERMSKLMNNL